jgi:hypothetical protein
MHAGAIRGVLARSEATQEKIMALALAEDENGGEQSNPAADS